jgi:hypothetical protein
LKLSHGQLFAGVGRAGGLRSGDATSADAAAPVSSAQTAQSTAPRPASCGEGGPLQVDGAGSVKGTTGSGPLGPTLHPAGAILRNMDLPSPALAFIDLLTMQFYTRGARRYLEWGSGGSTSLVAPLAQRAWSVDNNKEWCAKTADREDVKFVRGWLGSGMLCRACYCAADSATMLRRRDDITRIVTHHPTVPLCVSSCPVGHQRCADTVMRRRGPHCQLGLPTVLCQHQHLCRLLQRHREHGGDPV